MLEVVADLYADGRWRQVSLFDEHRLASVRTVNHAFFSWYLSFQAVPPEKKNIAIGTL
jgi:hypothetical protein